MFSIKTNLELVFSIEKLTKANIERMLIAFGLNNFITPLATSNAKLSNIFLDFLSKPNLMGPFTDSFNKDVLQYLLDHYYRDLKKEDYPKFSLYAPIAYDDLFANDYPLLSNSLKRDGYVIKGNEIRKALPEEIEESKTETELFRFLDFFGFNLSKSHLLQGIENHSVGNWAAANGQFRTFIESFLMEICRQLSGTSCNDAGQAITSLSNLNPPFLADFLNEIKSNNNGIDVGFVNGLWKRLHPQGSHPGISDEEDCTFRYHLTIVFTNYLLKRLAKRLTVSI